MGRIVVLALGGNALTHHGQAGTHEELAANAEAMARSISSLMLAGWEVVLVHGNGPQVGNLAIQQEEGSDVVPEQPLFSLGRHDPGPARAACSPWRCARCWGPGHRRSCRWSRTPRSTRPTPPSPIRRSRSARSSPPRRPRPSPPSGAGRSKEDAGRGWRRVVPSPEPVRILESGAIRALLDAGVVVIAAGGGGIPVVPTAGGHRGIDAVIDKDYAAERLATSLGADALVLVTSVEAVLLDYGTPQQRAMLEISVDDAEAHLADGQFPEGSMGPKVRAGVRFLRHGGEVAVITTPALVYASLEGTVSELEGRPGTQDRAGAAR